MHANPSISVRLAQCEEQFYNIVNFGDGIY
jgi:hypothetical protein